MSRFAIFILYHTNHYNVNGQEEDAAEEDDQWTEAMPQYLLASSKRQVHTYFCALMIMCMETIAFLGCCLWQSVVVHEWERDKVSMPLINPNRAKAN